MSKNQPLEEIPEQKKVKVTKMGNITEIMSLKNRCKEPFGIKKISKDEYVILATGEIKECQHIENRSQDKESLRKTFKTIRQLINTNFVGSPNELCFTITYRENMTDTKRLYKDFDIFIKRMRRRYSDFDYINVVEPQGRGAWHCHILLRFNTLKKAYIPNKTIAELWGKGFVTVKAIKSGVDNLGAYLSAYLGDVELREDNIGELCQEGIIQFNKPINVKETEVNGVKKKFIKGGRLNLYPPKMNIYRTSRGIKRPEIVEMTYEKAKKEVGNAIPTYSTRTLIQDDTGKIINSISYEQYNRIRKTTQESEEH